MFECKLLLSTIHAHRCSRRRGNRCSRRRGSRRSSVYSGLWGGGRSSSSRVAAACSSLPPSEDGYSRRRAAEAEDARAEAAAPSRSSAVRGMTWKWKKHRRRLWWILNAHACSPPNFHGSAACDWIYREEKTTAPDMTRAMSGMPIFITCCTEHTSTPARNSARKQGPHKKASRKTSASAATLTCGRMRARAGFIPGWPVRRFPAGCGKIR